MEDVDLIDSAFDVRTDAGDRDPDSHSMTLRRFHRQLWSKPLPCGAVFDLDSKLHHKSDLGEFWLSSDGLVHTYSRWLRPLRLVEVIQQVPPQEVERFYDLACTVGAYLVFPTQVYVDGRWRQTVNQRRGMHPKIRDRFDLTLECVRRHYDGTDSPLADVLTWHGVFFDLFQNFRGYVEHFLLDDLVTEDFAAVRFWGEFDDFAGDPLPAANLDEYREYMRRTMTFVRSRNERIARYASAHLSAAT